MFVSIGPAELRKEERAPHRAAGILVLAVRERHDRRALVVVGPQDAAEASRVVAQALGRPELSGRFDVWPGLSPKGAST